MIRVFKEPEPKKFVHPVDPVGKGFGLDRITGFTGLLCLKY